MYKRVIALVIGLLIGASVLPVSAFAIVSDTDLVATIPYAQRGIAPEQMVDIDALAGMLMTSEGEVLWSRNADERRPIASITKVMTAIVALERGEVDEAVRISPRAAHIGEASVGLSAGQTYPLRYLLEVMMVRSGNDAAYAIAEHIAGSEAAFAQMMNEMAAALKMTQTNFRNSHGLDAHNHYSTAGDVALMVRHAMQDPFFRELVTQHSTILPDGVRYTNSNELLATFEGSNGVKTGMTSGAGYCLAASARRGDIELYSVILAAPDNAGRFSDSAHLLEFGFAHFAPFTLMDAQTRLGEVEVLNHLDVSLSAGIAQSVEAIYYDLLGAVEYHYEIEPVSAPVAEGAVVGHVTFMQNGEVLATEPLVTFESIEAPTLYESFSFEITHLFRRLTQYTDEIVARPTVILETIQIELAHFIGLFSHN